MIIKSDLKVGDRVQLSDLGKSRYKDSNKTGTVIKLAKPASGSRTIEVRFDGNKQASRIHYTYVEKTP